MSTANMNAASTEIASVSLETLDSRIRASWWRSQVLSFATGAMAFFTTAIPLFLVGMFIDWMTYMPAPGRIGILAGVLAVACYRGWATGWRSLRSFNAVQIALQLESRCGGFNSLFVSAVQLRDQQQRSNASSDLCHHTCRLAEAAASDLKPRQAVPFTSLRRSLVVVTSWTAVIAIFFAVNGPFLSAGVTRFFAPWLNVEYPTNTHITISQHESVIKEGESAAIVAQINGVVPNKAVIHLQTGEGQFRELDLQVTGGTCTYDIASASRDFSYRVKAGDDRTDWYQVRVVPAPRIENVMVGLDYPPYLEREQESVESLTLAVPEGTAVDWQIVLDRPIRAAQFVRDGEVAVDLDVGDSGREISFSAQVPSSKGYHFVWVDRDHGFKFKSPRYFLQVAADQTPRIELTSPAKNLVAMLGRPLDLAVRAQDDHGLGSTNIAYRVNQRDEVSFKLAAPLQTGQGEQTIDWDYRESVNELQVGDSVAVAVEVSDRYPEPMGPHVVRSETRRITFLSKEDYLRQIEKQKDRLLSRVQTVYRQQRTAHEAIGTLDPASQGYAQACQLEAIRQEMVRDQLKNVASSLQLLLDDLEANGVSDVAEGAALEAVRVALIAIAENQLADAARILRQQSGMARDGEASGPEKASDAVNSAARDLGALVMLRGIDSAQEVYARELRMLARLQSVLRWQAITRDRPEMMQKIAQRQSEMAVWTEKLISDLQAGMRYQQRPLAVLRLIRSVKKLQNVRTVQRMIEVHSLIGKGDVNDATNVQMELVRTLLDAEFSVRLSGAYSTLLEARERIRALAAVQRRFAKECNEMNAEEFKSQQSANTRTQQALHKQLTTILLPSVPPSRAGLLDETMPVVPPVSSLRTQAGNAMIQTMVHLETGDQKAVAAQQMLAQQALDDLLPLMESWAVEMGLQTQGLGTVVADCSTRMGSIEEYEARVIGFLEKTDLALLEEKSLQSISDSQQNLVDEITGFVESLKDRNPRGRQSQSGSISDPDLPPLLRHMTMTVRLLEQSTEALRKNNAEMALDGQEKAADALAEAYSTAVGQYERLSLLQDLLLFQRSVGFANASMADIVAEQSDLLQLTEASPVEDLEPALPQFRNMLNCLNEVSPLLDMVAARLDVGTPLAFAQTDFEDAIAAIEAGDKFDAVDAQDVAAESLAEVQTLVQDIQMQTGYVAEIVAFLHQAVSGIALLQHQQDELRIRALAKNPADLKRLLRTQRELVARAENSASGILSATGMLEFQEPVDVMKEALAGLEQGDADSAAEAMELASEIYAENTESLISVITMLHGLPAIEIIADSDPALIQLIDVLALASDQKSLFRRTRFSDDASWKEMASRQTELAERIADVVDREDVAKHRWLDEARQQLSRAAEIFQPDQIAELRRCQKLGDEKLRHFIIEQALILETAAPLAVSSEGEGDSSEGSDSESAVAAGFISDFVSGEAARDQRTEWKVLGERNRAALNQNFARELPLEYRAFLKNYYERVAQ